MNYTVTIMDRKVQQKSKYYYQPEGFTGQKTEKNNAG
jgi:hypothetical protein